MKTYFLFCMFLCASVASAQSVDGWSAFARVKFSSTFFKELNQYFLAPSFDSRIKALEGKEITLQGYYMPLDVGNSNVIILSAYPYSECFFCGGAGPESVAEIVFASKHPRLKADQMITVKGILQLNERDVEHLNFILKKASIVTKP